MNNNSNNSTNTSVRSNINPNANPNSLDLGAIYGISPYVERTQTSPIPTLEELAAYSQYERESRYREQFQTPNWTTNASNNSSQMPQTMQQPTMDHSNSATSTMASSSNRMPSNSNELEAIMPYNQPYPVTAESIEYLNGFLRTQIGRRVSLEFLVGTSNLEVRQGILLAVGANFILINVENSDDIMACDFYNLKFVTFFY